MLMSYRNQNVFAFVIFLCILIINKYTNDINFYKVQLTIEGSRIRKICYGLSRGDSSNEDLARKETHISPINMKYYSTTTLAKLNNTTNNNTITTNNTLNRTFSNNRDNNLEKL